jgi:hypothetical protein
MKTILKVLLAVIVINAAARAGMTAKRYYQFKEAAQQAVLFGATTHPEELQEIIAQRARELQVPVTPQQIVVNRQGGRTWAEAAYRDRVEYFPNQVYPVDLSFSVEAYSMVLAPSVRN